MKEKKNSLGSAAVVLLVVLVFSSPVLLPVVFTILKLAGIGDYATWPWSEVLSPLILPVLIFGLPVVAYFYMFLKERTEENWMSEKFKNSIGYVVFVCVFLFLVFNILKPARIGVFATWPWWWPFSPFLLLALISFLWAINDFGSCLYYWVFPKNRTFKNSLGLVVLLECMSLPIVFSSLKEAGIGVFATWSDWLWLSPWIFICFWLACVKIYRVIFGNRADLGNWTPA